MIRRLRDWWRGYTDEDMRNVVMGCIPNTPSEWWAYWTRRYHRSRHGLGAEEHGWMNLK